MVTINIIPDKEAALNMEDNTALKYFENCCRICSCEHEKENLVSVFRNDDLLEKIASCLPITIHAEDRLPHEICENCCNSIEHCFEFVKKAQSSQNYFFNYLNNTPTVKIEKDDDEYIVETLEDNEKRVVSLDLEGSFQCDLCGEHMSEAVELDRHIEEQHMSQSSMPPNTEFTINKICSLCGQLFDFDHSYFFHKSESQNECSVCKKIMPSKCLLNRHIQHACKQLNFCPHCHKAFSAKMSFLKHVQDHTGEKFETDCLACDRKAKKKEEVMEHTCALADNKNTPSGKRYKCYVCGLSYKRQLNLARHCLQHEPKTAWKYKCVKCNDVFEKEKKLQTHYERVHKISRSWVCRFCGKSLSTKLSVQIHERIHTQVKPFVCEWCGNAFRCRPNLIQHQAMHTGIRPHKCHICGKKFSRPFFLQTHLRIHTGERPYECDICERRFTQLTDMRRHRKRHDKPSSRVSQPAIYVIQDTPEEIVEEVACDDDFPIETIELKVETS